MSFMGEAWIGPEADDEYRRCFQPHPHRSGRNGRRGLQFDTVFKDEEENQTPASYREFFFRNDPSSYAIERCTESVMDKENGHKHTREPVYEAAPPPPPAPVHHVFRLNLFVTTLCLQIHHSRQMG